MQHTSYTKGRARKVRQAVGHAVMAAVVALVALAASPAPEASAAVVGSPRFKSVDEAVAAGRIDAAVVDDLRASGSVEAISVVEHRDVGADRA
ncbi:MAG TPA: hypothetical protein VFZ83_06460, partial [Acidimicrobiia bacterium]|nr:hypothetical protein [Acidimicrobiia bacterium]